MQIINRRDVATNAAEIVIELRSVMSFTKVVQFVSCKFLTQSHRSSLPHKILTRKNSVTGVATSSQERSILRLLIAEERDYHGYDERYYFAGMTRRWRWHGVQSQASSELKDARCLAMATITTLPPRCYAPLYLQYSDKHCSGDYHYSTSTL
ncbi:hypothetical protein J6590_050595, partial [Homalodisca vitripennis]